jgi:hypothetical protein
MSASKIESWIKSLGRTHEYLLSESLVSDDELVELFSGDDQVYLQPEKGISMTFRDEDGRFESFCITLIKVFPEEREYHGDLPDPYTLNMNKPSVHRIFGTPSESSGPAKMPFPIGLTGGWDAYPLDQTLYPNAKVTFHYLESEQVDYIAFSLLDKIYD